MSYTYLELQKCAEREVAMRRSVFNKHGMTPKRVAEVAMMEQIASHFAKMAQVGPTNDYPHGKLSDDDEGGINVALSRHIAPDGSRMVRLDFGKPLAWLSLPGEQAIQFAMTMMKHAGFVGSIIVGHGEIVDAEDSGRSRQANQSERPLDEQRLRDGDEHTPEGG